MKYKTGDRVYYKGRKTKVLRLIYAHGWHFLILSGVNGQINITNVKPIVRCKNDA